ncbi:hypothetical protein SD70_08455 [Gordoniibacillus kamchatkensis]|uniref:Uncharacterized protein n=1 Tax=Gordoniibacillus kamchatkensis TaxID=1590651 RepID=A0ABR5AJR6_9BACL|nr:hypothetical protein SD70_08455 [Paenibacillus sp. VKM B-2647]
MQGHWFNVDIFMDGDNNAHALEELNRLLNAAGIKEYRVHSGGEPGTAAEAGKPDTRKEPAADKAEAPSALALEIERYKANNTLVRMTVVKGKGVKLDLPCRILNYDAATQNVSIYHVDEKKVYLFRINEIDDLHAG